MDHATRRAKGRTTNSGITLTDQSQAADTNINVILQKYGVTGTVPGTKAAPEYLDHTEMPQDLRSAIETARSADTLRKQLPPQLRDKTLEELSALTTGEIQTILTPPAPPAPEPPKGETPK